MQTSEDLLPILGIWSFDIFQMARIIVEGLFSLSKDKNNEKYVYKNLSMVSLIPKSQKRSRLGIHDVIGNTLNFAENC